MMIVWYVPLFSGWRGRNLEKRLIFLWLPSSTITLYAEHISSEKMYDPNKFLEHALLNSLHYIAGYYMFYLPLWCGVPLVAVALCGYLSLCYKRYYLSETKLHKYSVMFEIIITTCILPIFLVTDLLMKNPPEKQFFRPYVMIDMSLKVIRTTLLCYFRDEYTRFAFNPIFFAPRKNGKLGQVHPSNFPQ